MNIYMVIGWTNDGKNIYGTYDDKELAHQRKEELEGHPYETYELVTLKLNRACNI